jgi:hypothetical protein
MNDLNKRRLSEKTGFNLVIGLIIAISLVAFITAMLDRPLATPLLTTGVLGVVIAFFLAMLRTNRPRR